MTQCATGIALSAQAKTLVWVSGRHACAGDGMTQRTQQTQPAWARCLQWLVRTTRLARGCSQVDSSACHAGTPEPQSALCTVLRERAMQEGPYRERCSPSSLSLAKYRASSVSCSPNVSVSMSWCDMTRFKPLPFGASSSPPPLSAMPRPGALHGQSPACQPSPGPLCGVGVGRCPRRCTGAQKAGAAAAPDGRNERGSAVRHDGRLGGHQHPASHQELQSSVHS